MWCFCRYVCACVVIIIIIFSFFSSPLYSYLIFVIKDEKQIVVEKQGERNGKYENFVSDLLAAGPDDCRYGVFDYEYDHLGQGTASSVVKQKLILMSWYVFVVIHAILASQYQFMRHTPRWLSTVFLWHASRFTFEIQNNTVSWSFGRLLIYNYGIYCFTIQHQW